MMFELTSKLDRPWNGRARTYFVEHHPERPEVGPRVRGVAAKLLGRHIGDRPDYGPTLREGDSALLLRRGQAELRSAHLLCETKVEHLDVPFGGHDHVRALQVPMDHAACVRVDERFGDLSAVTEDVVQRQALSVHEFAEGPAFDELHRDVGLPVRLADVVDGADRGVVQGGCGPSLAHESSARHGILEGRGRQELERHVSIEMLVMRAIHLAHAARPEHRENAIVAELPTDHER
jgi:hypothetical protein